MLFLVAHYLDGQLQTNWYIFGSFEIYVWRFPYVRYTVFPPTNDGSIEMNDVERSQEIEECSLLEIGFVVESDNIF